MLFRELLNFSNPLQNVSFITPQFFYAFFNAFSGQVGSLSNRSFFSFVQMNNWNKFCIVLNINSFLKPRPRVFGFCL